jgi:hypothetical protein
MSELNRVDALRLGRTQWGCNGRHHGNGSPDCPRELHHHHDMFCEPPSKDECAEAGVAYRKPWEWGRR